MERQIQRDWRRIVVGLPLGIVAATLSLTPSASAATAPKLPRQLVGLTGPTQTLPGSVAAQGGDKIVDNTVNSNQDPWSGSQWMQSDIRNGLPARLAHGYDSIGQAPPLLASAGHGVSMAAQGGDKIVDNTVDSNQDPWSGSQWMQSDIRNGLPARLAHGYDSIGQAPPLLASAGQPGQGQRRSA